MKSKPGIRVLLVLALVLFALVMGVGSALVEIAAVTHGEVQSTVARADLACRMVTSQLNIALQSVPGQDPAQAIRSDSRLAAVIKDAHDYTPSVFYVLIADTLGTVLAHNNPEMIGERVETRPALAARSGLGALQQFVSILRRSDVYELRLPLALNGRDFGSVRVGLVAWLLKDKLRMILWGHILKILLQVSLAVAAGVVVSWLMIMRPLSRVEEGIDYLRRGDFSHRVPVVGQDELGQLANQINELSETLGRERERFDLQRANLVSEGDALRRIVDSVDDGLLMLDRDRKVLMANRTIARLLGRQFPEIAGRALGDMLPGNHPLVKLVDLSFNGDQGQGSVQMEIKTPEGNRTFLASCRVVGESPNQQGAVLALRDYGRIQEIQRMLDHAQVLSQLGRMASGVAHEVRNPLNAMTIHLELLSGKLSSVAELDGAKEHVNVVRREIARLERVVYGFLKLARVQGLNLAPIHVPQFLGELKTLVLPEARMAGLDINMDVSGDLPDIYGDEELLRQAMLNILRNAIQASPAGSSPITVAAGRQADTVCLRVKDHGRGMTPEVQAKAFDLYFTTRKDGSGVGLALVRQTLEMHGGRVDLESAPGQGTTFTVCLPALPAA